MGILNATPDSFSDGGELSVPGVAADRAEAMLRDGAAILDLGGESTRPGARPVPEPEQIRRVLPALAAIRARVGPAPVITIDTTRAAVAAAALDAGADAINDVSGGLDDPAMLPLAAARRCGIILMHRLLPPAADSYSSRYGQPGQAPPPQYGDVVADVRDALAALLARAVGAGVEPRRVMLDPGLGFGKTVAHNLALLRGTPQLLTLGRPILSALSRKSFTAAAAGLAADRPPAERLAATLALSVLHLQAGARIFRVHDVAPHAHALQAAWSALRADAAPERLAPPSIGTMDESAPDGPRPPR